MSFSSDRKIPSTKEEENFVTEKELKQENELVRYSHPTSQVKKKPPVTAADLAAQKLMMAKQKYKNIWYKKKIPNAEEAMIEVIAQELFRLLIPIPGQPKTRLARNANNEIFVLSKKGEVFENLEYVAEREHVSYLDKILDHSLSGLGDIALISYFLSENDLKAGNVGRNEKNRLVKIDGDHCFARFQKERMGQRKYDITAAGIMQLPYIDRSEYRAHNWLGTSSSQGTSTHEDKAIIALKKISNDPQFRAEMNAAILRAIVLPDELIKKFILSYIPQSDFADSLCREVISRRDRLMYAAAQNDSFQAYLNASPGYGAPPKAHHDFSAYCEHLRTFNTTSKNSVLGNEADEKQEMLKKIEQQRDKVLAINKNIKEDTDAFKKLDVTVYPILQLADDPRFPERQLVVDRLKALARSAYELGAAEGYKNACEFVKSNLVGLADFLKLDNVAAKILSMKDNHALGWQERQNYIDKLKDLAKQYYQKIAVNFADSNPGKELRDLVPQIDRIIYFDLQRCEIQEVPDDLQLGLELKERQEKLAYFKKYAKDSYLLLSEGMSIHALPAANESRIMFMDIELIALPILKMKDFSGQLAYRQPALDGLKQNALKFHKDYDLSHCQNLADLKRQFKAFEHLCKLTDKLSTEIDQRMVADIVARSPERNSAILAFKRRLEKSFSNPDLERAYSVELLEDGANNFIEMDVLACQFLDLPDSPNCQERQEKVNALKKIGKEFYRLVGQDSSLKLAGKLLEDNRKTLNEFQKTDKIVFPIIQYAGDISSGSNKQLVFDALKAAALSAYAHYDKKALLELDLNFYYFKCLAEMPKHLENAINIKLPDEVAHLPIREAAIIEAKKKIGSGFDSFDLKVNDLQKKYESLYTKAGVPFEAVHQLIVKLATYIEKIKKMSNDYLIYSDYRAAVNHFFNIIKRASQENALDGFGKIVDEAEKVFKNLKAIQASIDAQQQLENPEKGVVGNVLSSLLGFRKGSVGLEAKESKVADATQINAGGLAREYKPKL